jgi:hypothetical protein
MKASRVSGISRCVTVWRFVVGGAAGVCIVMSARGAAAWTQFSAPPTPQVTYSNSLSLGSWTYNPPCTPCGSTPPSPPTVALAPYFDGSTLKFAILDSTQGSGTSGPGWNLDSYNYENGNTWTTIAGMYFEGIWIDADGFIWGWTQTTNSLAWSAKSPINSFSQFEPSLQFSSFASDSNINKARWATAYPVASLNPCGGEPTRPTGWCGQECIGVGTSSSCSWVSSPAFGNENSWGGIMVTLDHTASEPYDGGEPFAFTYVVDFTGSVWWLEPYNEGATQLSTVSCSTGKILQFARIAAKNTIIYAIEAPVIGATELDTGTVYWLGGPYGTCWTAIPGLAAASIATDNNESATEYGVWASDANGAIWYTPQP